MSRGRGGCVDDHAWLPESEFEDGIVVNCSRTAGLDAARDLLCQSEDDVAFVEGRRELGGHGVRELVDIKTVWIGPQQEKQPKREWHRVPRVVRQ